MPLYEYECDACGHRFEIIQKFSDPPVETCPSCGGKVRKLQSAPAFQFKGSGWYVTDYAKTGTNAETKASKEGRQADKDAAGKADSAAATSDTSSSSEKAASSPTSSTGSGGSTGAAPSTASTGPSGTGAAKSGTTKSGTTKSGD